MIYAKIIVVDRGVTIVSSMNFYAGSSDGKAWETGRVVSLEVYDWRKPPSTTIVRLMSSS